jgi:hypothetical protein
MSLETRKVLDMVAEGKITAADAERLLNKLESAAPATGEAKPGESPNDAATSTKRYLRIVVDEPGRKPVNIRMPLAFARAGLSMAGMLPRNVAEKLKERGIDLDQFRVHTGFGKDDGVEMLKQLDLDVDKGDGKKVRIFCE